ncbi:hypothetical protein LPJ61_004048 [Coemansia biformis]|uniref:G-protein coupled receptors family 3 profile domain-containing protein n=1 Tax=Coemansia biformis TaxID=1286918 RepID=A0A9W8CVQ8_9FUNG|nr:hypothetical protein LPJ61_004048 [Coemansia biformis]
MYYDYSPEEKLRVEVAAFFGIEVDPIGHGDLAAVLGYSLLLAVGFVATVYTWANRHYAPLKAKNIPLMTGIYLHSVFFFLGDLTLCGLVHVRGSFFGDCMLMLIWFRSMFGNFALGSLLTIRSFKLYCIFCRNKPMHGYRRAIPYLLFLALITAVGMIATLVPRKYTVTYIEGVEFCIVNQNLVTAFCILLWCIWAVYMVMVWLLRNVRSSFNEFMEMAISLLLLVVCTIFNQVVLNYMPRLPTSLRWRLALVTVDQITANYIWWLIMFKPIFNCIFRHDKYLAEWKHKMTSDGLRSQYGMSAVDTDLTINSSTPMYSRVDGEKSIKPDPSYTESTHQAVQRLAAFAGARPSRLSAAADGWCSPARCPPAAHGSLGISYSSTPGHYPFERRKSEPYADAAGIRCAVPGAAASHGRLPARRMLAQHAAPHDDSMAVPIESSSSSQCMLEVELLPRPSGPGILNTVYGRGSLDHYPPHGQRHTPQIAEYPRWQHSDTDLSLMSSGHSGGRQLL